MKIMGASFTTFLSSVNLFSHIKWAYIHIVAFYIKIFAVKGGRTKQLFMLDLFHTPFVH